MLLKQCIFVACIVLGSNLAAAAAHDVPPHVSGSPLADIVNRHRASSARELPAYHGVPAPSAAISTHPEHRGDAAVAQAPLPASIDRGMTFFSLSPDAFSDPATLAELDALSEMGGEWVGCVIFLHMSSPTSSTISIDDSTASDASVITFLKHAATLPNIKVMVKPIVVPHGGTMLNIVPNNATQWFDDYSRFMLHYATLGEQYGAHAVSMGVEYYSISGPDYADRWRTVVANVRSVFSGDLTYCSLFYKEWQNINWWDALDWMGIDAYFFLAYPGTVTPSVATMAVQLAKDFDKVRSFRANHSLTHIPLVFTEVGYGSYTTVAGSPGTSPPTESCGANFTSDFGAQQRCYETLFQVSAANADMLDKLILFWFDNPSTPDFYVNATHHRPVWDCWFTPRGKPAYKSMQAAFAAP